MIDIKMSFCENVWFLEMRGNEPSRSTIQATSPFVERNSINYFVRILLHSSKIWTKSYSSTTVCNEQNLISTTRCLILSMRHVLFDKFVSDWAIAPVNSLRCALGEWQRFWLWEFFDLPNHISILFVRWWIWMHESNDWILKTKERVPPGRATISSNIWDTMLFQPATAAVVHKAYPTIPLRTSPFSPVAYGGYLTLVNPFSKQCKGKCFQRI
jgi:hypothetical protein